MVKHALLGAGTALGLAAAWGLGGKVVMGIYSLLGGTLA
jgi:hypothetical protein